MDQMSILDWIETVVQRSVGERPRALSVIGSRAYIETHLPSHLDMGRFRQLLTDRAQDAPWIDQVFVEPFTHRIVLHVRGPMPDNDALTDFAEGVERALGAVNGAPQARERRLPDDDALENEQRIEVIADALAVFFGSALRWVPLVPRGLGQNLHALLFVISESERLRAPLDRRLGRERSEFVLQLARASAQGIAQRPLSALVELSAKAFGLRELRARRDLWQSWAAELTEVQAEASASSELPEARPCELPKGPVERYSERALTMALGSFGVSLLTTRSPSRAVAAGFSALPRPVQLGRELYCAELGRELAKQGTLVLSSQALRRLDRVDCLVIPARLVAREQFVIGDVHGLSGISREQALELAGDLFVPARPLRVQQHGPHTLGPIRLLSQPLAPELERLRTERASRGALMLALSRDNEVVALVEVQISAQAGVVELLNVARRASLRIVLATDDLEAAEGLHPDDIVPLTSGLEAGIRRLQTEGRTVMLVGRGHLPAFATADVGVGLFVRGEPAPWGAHLICPDDTRALETVIAACVAARKVSEQSAKLGMGALAFGTLAASGARTSPALARVFFVLNATSLASMVNAVRSGSEVTHVTRKVTDPTPWHALEVEGVLARLGSTHEGLALPTDADQVTEARDAQREPAWLELARAIRVELMNPLSPLLAVGAGISAMVGSMADAGIVAGVGGINALIGGYQRFRTERAIDHLVQRAETRVHVKRAGTIASVPTSSLQRGDILLLSQGDFVPADCRILDSESLEVDTSTLTGESLPVLKNATPSFAETFPDITSMVYEGATIAAGRATVVVVATGEDTALRRGAAATPDETRGGVEARLRELMRLTGPVAAGAGALLVIAGFLRGRRVDDLVSTGVGLAVAAVPEGLPLLATAAQLSAAERLSRRGSLVKNPRAIEALGRIDVLCVDKTGTLTEGRIELSLVSDGAVSAALSEASPALREVLRAAGHAVGRDRGLTVDPMDRAILSAADAHGLSDLVQLERLAERAFESGRGFQAMLGRAGDDVVMYVKGAPEQLIDRASHAVIDGAELTIRAARTRLHAELRRLGQDGLRIIAVAQRTFPAAAFDPAAPTALLSEPTELRLLGFLAFRDPTRPTAEHAVAGLARAGVRVIMMTGDHASTAESVARDVGLVSDHGVITGAEVAQLDEAALEDVARRKSVFARVTPAQKVRIVRALQRAGHVVGMVGDGANDAPAMRIADVGIAVGAHCTEAARGAADIVLADARIDALVGAVIEGRAMWSSVRDAVSILVGGNLGEIAFTVGVGGLTGRPPLHPRQLLLVNFLTDIAPSMAIALRPPKQAELDQLEALGPGGALGAPLNRDILSRAVCTAFGAGVAWTVGRVTGSAARARTIGLVGLVGSQLGQTLLAGGNSKAVRYTSLGSLAALALIVQTPGLSHVFGCKPLGPIAWSTALSASALATLISPAVDAMVRRTADFVVRVHEPKAPPVVEVVTPQPKLEAHESLQPALRLLRN
jgi:cation-transporting ATPase I